MCLPAVTLGPKQPAEALGLFLSRPERPGDLHGHRRLRQIDGEVCDFRNDEAADLAPAERVEQGLAVLRLRRSLDDRRVERFAEFSSWSR